jgi:hypothetical protein
MAEAAFILPALVAGGTALAVGAMNKPPKPERPVRMPDENSPEVVAERRRRIEERQAAGGRESTILSDDTYSNDLLGQ